MVRITATSLCVCLLCLAGVTFAADPRETVDTFGAALLAGDADGLRTTLPSEGKVRVRLIRLGPQEGALRGSQLHAVLQDFLEHASVSDFVVKTIRRSGKLALASTEVGLVDARGTAATVGLHLSLEPENNRWVLREIRESSR